MVKQPKFEIIVNGEVVKTVRGWNALEKTEEKYYDKANKLGMTQECHSSSGSHGYILWFNSETAMAMAYAWREDTEFTDKNGERIYYGDRLSMGLDFYDLNQSPWSDAPKKGYYLRNTKRAPWGSYEDIKVDEDEIKKYSVVHKIFPEVVNKLKK